MPFLSHQGYEVPTGVIATDAELGRRAVGHGVALGTGLPKLRCSSCSSLALSPPRLASPSACVSCSCPWVHSVQSRTRPHVEPRRLSAAPHSLALTVLGTAALSGAQCGGLGRAGPLWCPEHTGTHTCAAPRPLHGLRPAGAQGSGTHGHATAVPVAARGRDPTGRAASRLRSEPSLH